MNVHQHGLQHSVITHLQALTDKTVIWQFGGVKLPDKAPFATVEQMQNDNEILSKQRESVQTTYRFQIGYYASSATDRAQTQELIRRSLIFDEMEYLDTNESPVKSDGFFRTELTAEVPFNAVSVDEATKNHRVFFDVEIAQVIRASR